MILFERCLNDVGATCYRDVLAIFGRRSCNVLSNVHAMLVRCLGDVWAVFCLCDVGMMFGQCLGEVCVMVGSFLGLMRCFFRSLCMCIDR